MKPMAILNVTMPSCVQCLASGGRGSKQNECPEELKGFEAVMVHGFRNSFIKVKCFGLPLL